jgi:hypothetical protein
MVVDDLGEDTEPSQAPRAADLLQLVVLKSPSQARFHLAIRMLAEVIA